MRTMAIGAEGARREGVAGAGIRQVLQTQAHKSSDLMVWRQRSYQRGAAGRVYRVLEMHHAGVTERPLGRCHCWYCDTVNVAGDVAAVVVTAAALVAHAKEQQASEVFAGFGDWHLLRRLIFGPRTSHLFS